MEIQIKETQLADYLQAAVLQALGENAKALIIDQVVRYLVTPQASYNGRTQASPLQEAINSAATRVATTFVAEKLEKDAAFIAQLEDVMKLAIEKTFAEKEKLADRMASAMQSVLRGERY